jgi:RNA polymerase sigma factor (sigma-70 family)
VRSDIHELVLAAQAGNRDALEQVASDAQGYIYNLALRMLQHPAEAEDATQEILIKLITHLGQFRGESAFSTWMYRLASNMLLNLKRRDTERGQASFDELSDRLETSLAHYELSPESQYEHTELAEEVKRNCTLGMLMCLNHEDRLALILGEVLEVSSDEGGEIMAISPVAYRKRLSRARQSLVGFVSGQCGIVNPDKPCRCHKHVQNKLRMGLLDPAKLIYAPVKDAMSDFHAGRTAQADLTAEARTIALIRAHPAYNAGIDCHAMIERILNAGDPDR